MPVEWLEEVRRTDEDSILEVAKHLPAEAGEALLELALGRPKIPHLPATVRVFAGADTASLTRQDRPFDHPDAQRRFRTISSVEELERALDSPWEKWTVFLHPEQRKWVEADYNGPVRVSGSAGTGKTVVAIHRAVFLARANPDSRVLLTTYSDILANALRTQLWRLISKEPRMAERLEVHSIDAMGQRLLRSQPWQPTIVTPEQVRALMKEAAATVSGHKFTMTFLLSEWEQVVDAWQLDTWESYRDVKRLGRKTRLPEAQRAVLWSIFDRVRTSLATENMVTQAGLLSKLATTMAERKHPPFDFAVIDEAQDFGVAQLRFLAALGAGRPNALFFTGDLGQRIFQQPFSWRALGVDIRGRSRTLHVNYRTSHQIRSQADRLLSKEVSDVDGNKEDRSRTISVFNGPAPTIQVLSSTGEERDFVRTWILDLTKQGLMPHEFGVFVRSAAELDRARAAVESTGLPFKVLDDYVETTSGQISVSTMHLAKGLEFRAVVVMACDDEVIPLQERIETVTDDSDLEEVYNTERHLLYVACTRARDHLLVTSAAPASEFLDDMRK